jgi:hypothetical protein
MLSRLQPLIALEFPERDEELEILRYNVDFAPDQLLDLTVNFLQKAHRFNLNYSTRDGINIMRFALKLHHGQEEALDDAFQRSVDQILGEGADRFEERATGMFFEPNVKDISEFMTRDQDFDEETDEENP